MENNERRITNGNGIDSNDITFSDCAKVFSNNDDEMEKHSINDNIIDEKSRYKENELSNRLIKKLDIKEEDDINEEIGWFSSVCRSIGKTLACKEVNKNKRIFVAIIVFILCLIAVLLGIIIPFSLKTNSHLVYERNFGFYDSYTYTKKGSLCVKIKTSRSSDSINCRESNSIHSFNVMNISDYLTKSPFDLIEDFDKNDEKRNLKYKEDDYSPVELKVKLITFMLHLRKMTINNGTDIITLVDNTIEELKETKDYNQNFEFNNKNDNYNLDNSYLEDDSKTELLNDKYSTSINQVTVIVFSMFQNGTIYNIFKPDDMDDQIFYHMLELIEDYSPNLAKDTYKSQNQNNKKVSSTPDFDDDGEYYGNLKINPNYSIDNQNDIFNSKKIINKDSFLEYNLPSNSKISQINNYNFNQTTKFLQSSNQTAYSSFEHNDNHTGSLEEGTSNFFSNDNKNQYDQERDYFKTNYLNDTGLQKIEVEYNGYSVLDEVIIEDKNTTESLIYLVFRPEGSKYQEFNYTKYKSERQGYFFNKTLDKEVEYLKQQTKESGMKKRLLEEEHTVNELKRTFSIVYPIYQFGFFGFKSNMDLGIEIRPYENKVYFFVYLKVDGVFNTKIINFSKDIETKGMIDSMIRFLFESYDLLKKLNRDVENFLNSDLIIKLIDSYKKVGDLINLPFDVQQLLTSQTNEFNSQLIKALNDLEINSLNYVNDNKEKIIFPLSIPENLENLKTDIKSNIKEYIDFYKKSLIDMDSQIVNDLIEIMNLSSTKDTIIYPDMIEDLKLLAKEIESQFKDNFSVRIKNEQNPKFEEILSSIFKNFDERMRKNFETLGNILNLSDYSNKLLNAYRELNDFNDKQSKSSANFITRFPEEAVQNIDSKTYIPIETQAIVLVDDVTKQNTKTIEELQKHPIESPILKQYEILYEKYKKIFMFTVDEAFNKIANLFNFPLIIDVIQPLIKTYISEYDTYINENVEKKIRDAINSKKMLIDSTIKQTNDKYSLFNSKINGLLDSKVYREIYNDILFKNIINEIEFNLEKDLLEYQINGLIYDVKNLFKNSDVIDENNKLISCKTNLYQLKNEKIKELNNLLKVDNLKNEFKEFLTFIFEQLKTSIPLVNKEMTDFNLLNDLPDSPVDIEKLDNIYKSLIDDINVFIDNSVSTLKSNYLEKIDFTSIQNPLIDILKVNTTQIDCKTEEFELVPKEELEKDSYCLVFNISKESFDKEKPKNPIECLVVDKLSNKYTNFKKIEEIINREKTKEIQTLKQDTIINSFEFISNLSKEINKNIEILKSIKLEDLDEAFENYKSWERSITDKTIFNDMIAKVQQGFTIKTKEKSTLILNEFTNIIENIENEIKDENKFPTYFINEFKSLMKYFTDNFDNFKKTFKTELSNKYYLNLTVFLQIRKIKFQKTFGYFQRRIINFMPHILKNPLLLYFEKQAVNIDSVFKTFDELNTNFVKAFMNQYGDSISSKFSEELDKNFIEKLKIIVNKVESNKDDFMEISKETNPLRYEYNSYESVKKVFLSIDTPLDVIGKLNSKDIDNTNNLTHLINAIKSLFESNYGLIKSQIKVVVDEKLLKINNLKKSLNSEIEGIYKFHVDEFINLVSKDENKSYQSSFLDFCYIYSNNFKNNLESQYFHFEKSFNEWLENIKFYHESILNKDFDSINNQTITNMINFREELLKIINKQFLDIIAISVKRFNQIFNEQKNLFLSLFLNSFEKDLEFSDVDKKDLNELEIDINNVKIKNTIKEKITEKINAIYDSKEFQNLVLSTTNDLTLLMQNKLDSLTRSFNEQINNYLKQFSAFSDINEKKRQSREFKDSKEMKNDKEMAFNKIYLDKMLNNFDDFKNLISYFAETRENDLKYIDGKTLFVSEENNIFSLPLVQRYSTLISNNLYYLYTRSLKSININVVLDISTSLSNYRKLKEKIEEIYDYDNNTFSLLKSAVESVSFMQELLIFDENYVFNNIINVKSYGMDYLFPLVLNSNKNTLNFLNDFTKELDLSNDHIVTMLSIQKEVHYDNFSNYFKVVSDKLNETYCSYLSSISSRIKNKMIMLVLTEKDDILKSSLLKNYSKLIPSLDIDMKKQVCEIFISKFDLINFVNPRIESMNNELNPLFTNVIAFLKSKITQSLPMGDTAKIYKLISKNLVNIHHYSLVPIFEGKDLKETMELRTSEYQAKMDEMGEGFNNFISNIDNLIDENSEKIKQEVVDKINPVVQNSIINPTEEIKSTIMDNIKKTIEWIANKIDEVGRKMLGIQTLIKKLYLKSVFDSDIDYISNYEYDISEINNDLNSITNEINSIHQLKRSLVISENDYISNEEFNLNSEQDLSIKDLINESDRFVEIVKKIKSIISSLPDLTNIFRKLNVFYDFCKNGKDIYVNQLNSILSKLDEIILKRKMDQIKIKLSLKAGEVSQDVNMQLKSVETSFKEIPELTEKAAIEVMNERIKKYINEAKVYIAKQIAKALHFEIIDLHNEWNHEIKYSVTIPVGPVPLEFSIGVIPAAWLKLKAALEGLDLYLLAEVGVSCEARGSAGVNVLLLKVGGYIKGVITKMSAGFRFDYLLENFSAKSSLVLSGEFGDMRCGVHVEVGFYFLKTVCNFIKKVERTCSKIFKWFGMKWVCKLIDVVYKVCHQVSELGWKHDFLDYPIIKPLVYQKVIPLIGR